MKQLFVVLMTFCSIALLTSCEKDNLNSDSEQLIEDIISSAKTQLDESELPSSIVEYIDLNYFETYIENASLAKGSGYEVQLGSGEDIYFTEDEEPIEGEFRRGKCGHRFGGHGGRKGGKGHGFRGPKGDSLNVDSVARECFAIEDLPANITDYITTNYPDAEIKRAKLKNEGTEYWVGLADHTVLTFDADGNFVEEKTFVHECGKGTRLTLEELPATVADYLTTNYPDAEFKKAMQKEDGTYRVGLHDGDTRVLLIFDADGNFVEVKTKG